MLLPEAATAVAVAESAHQALALELDSCLPPLPQGAPLARAMAKAAVAAASPLHHRPQLLMMQVGDADGHMAGGSTFVDRLQL